MDIPGSFAGRLLVPLGHLHPDLHDLIRKDLVPHDGLGAVAQPFI